MKCFFIFCFTVLVCSFSSCIFDKESDELKMLGQREDLVKKIDSLQKKMFDQQNMQVNPEIASREIGLYQDFVTKFPEDSLSPEYLFRSSDLIMSLGDTAKSVEYLARICKSYPNFKKIPECLFFQGFYYQDRDSSQAKFFYNQLIAKYPNHDFVDDAKALMQMFGKSQDQIIDDFEKKASGKKKI